jgi:MinD superfamily P-loop ATPase
VRITIASGKGGTGKTTVATSLALSLAMAPGDGLSEYANHRNRRLLFLDCDVEAPNAHLFLEPTLDHREEVGLFIPRVDESLCTYCGRCAEVCQWHAVAVVGKKLLVFPQLCHGCGSCTLACPEEAISEVFNPIGVIERGSARAGIQFAHGILNVGEPMAVPIIRELKRLPASLTSATALLDASPGTTCPVVEAMRESDFVLLVTEPTPFGLHDLRLAAQVAAELDIPAGVIINRQGIGDQGVEDYCQQAGLPILMQIPLDQTIAEGIAQGRPLVDIRPEYVQQFHALFEEIVEITRAARVPDVAVTERGNG